MSSITYHYGSKQGLYVAAARHIADRMGERMAPALAASKAMGREGPDAALLAIIDRFAEMMVHPESAAWARFIVREQMEPTEAFDVLYGGMMGRVVDHLSALIVRMGGGRCDLAEARLRTVAIVGQALVFRVAGDLAPVQRLDQRRSRRRRGDPRRRPRTHRAILADLRGDRP